MHHGCRHVVNDMDHPILGEYERKPTMVGMDYAGRYRCMECKRLIRYECDDPETYQIDLECAQKVEPPYPEGYC